ncbi:MAG: glycerol-3-phosphate 1-O-acyltransferase PlsY [Alphaproteobacteria bacterium]|nr:glycerol-3-phosphate 1-O-acyltransferase PlsY [Alphaproteobacteria bacterium]
MLIYAVIVVLAYLLGSVPFGLLLTRWANMGDIRAIGSGNIGATNVLRTGNKRLAAITLLLDMLKGVLAVSLGRLIGGDDAALLAGVLVVIGHVFPLWLRFKGGKGVATGIGVLLGLHPLIGITVIVCWIGVFWFSRFSSVSSMASLGIAPMLALLTSQYDLAFVTLAIATMVFFRHRGNIERLVLGTEPRFHKDTT